MPIEIDDETKKWIQQSLSAVKGPVTLKVFYSNDEGKCPYCKEVIELVKMVAGLSDLVKVELLEFEKESKLAEEYLVDKVPAILIHGGEEHNVRYFGTPAGYEFGAFIEDIVEVSTGEPDVNPQVADVIKGIRDKVHILVFVTPTCPYCPIAVRTAHKFAMLNKNFYSDMIEAYEFPKLAEKYRVYSVPKIVINDKVEIEGAVSERTFASKIMEALGRE